MLKTGIALFAVSARRALAQWPRHLATHLLAVALGAVVLWPLFAAMRDLLVRLSGDRAVADFGIATFLLSPVGLATLLVLGAALIGLLVFEIAAMMTIDIAARRAAPAGALTALRFVGQRAPAILGFGLGLALRLAAMAVPALVFGALVARRFLTEHDINYYLAFHPPEFRIAAGLIVAAGLVTGVLVVRKLVHWSLALPLVLFGETPPRGAFARSAGIVRKQGSGIIAALVVWFAATAGLGLVASGLIYGLGHLVMPAPDAPSGRLALALGLVGALFLAVQAGLRTFQNASLATLLTENALRVAPDLLTRELPAPRADSRVDRGLPGWVAAAGLAVVAAAVAITGSLHVLGGLAGTGREVQVIAHRAGAGAAPENTMAAVERALADGADWLEIDVQEAADGTVVVIHDRDLMRQAGLPRAVHELTPGDLAGIDIGSWFGPGFADQRLMTLDDVLAAVRGRARLLIELKHYGHAERLEERVIAAVERHDMADAVAVMSLDHDSVARMKSLRPDWPAGLLVARALGDLAGLDADFLAVNAALARPALVRHVHGAGQSVHVWTMNEPAAMRAMLLRGADGLITDHPALASEIGADYAALPPVRRVLLLVGSTLGFTDGG